jgi:hypothetical protein
MKTIRTQSLKDGIYSVSIEFDSYGRRDLTSTQEREIIENYGCKLIFKDIDFSDYYKVENGSVVKGTSSDGDLVKLNLNNQEIPLNGGLLLEYKVKSEALSDSVIGTNLTSKEKVATAMCKLFADKCEEAITKIIDEAVAKTDDFESVTDVTL